MSTLDAPADDRSTDYGFDAVLWDLDGTIVDTEPLWIGAETELAQSYGREWTTADALALVGSDLMDAGTTIQAKLDLPLSPREIVDYLIERIVQGLRDDIPWRPGAAELITELAAAGVPQALVTMSWSVIAEPFAEKLPFDAVVTGDIVDRGKPHPDPYLAAAAQLGLDPKRCIAVEDSPTGARSATAAGCFVLAVPHVVDVPDESRHARLDTLDGVSVADLTRLVQG